MWGDEVLVVFYTSMRHTAPTTLRKDLGTDGVLRIILMNHSQNRKRTYSTRGRLQGASVMRLLLFSSTLSIITQPRSQNQLTVEDRNKSPVTRSCARKADVSFRLI